jgi:nonribosomal peptide synthetase DhbF
MVLHAGLAALLSRLGPDTDIAIGSPIAGRTDEALEELIGFFVNTLVLRTDTSANPSFSELLARVRTVDLAAYAHQELPFERLVELLNPVRSLARHPLFQVMLAFQNIPETVLELPGIVARLEPVAINTAKFDLSLSLSKRRAPDGRPEGIEGLIEYRTDLFERSSVEAVGRRLAALLEAAVADPGQPIGRIELLTPEERARFSSSGTTRPAICHRPRCRRCSRPRWSAVLKKSRCSLSRARAPHAQPTGGVLMGAVAADRLAGMRFGGLSGSRTLFDCEPVIFG